MTRDLQTIFQSSLNLIQNDTFKIIALALPLIMLGYVTMTMIERVWLFFKHVAGVGVTEAEMSEIDWEFEMENNPDYQLDEYFLFAPEDLDIEDWESFNDYACDNFVYDGEHFYPTNPDYQYDEDGNEIELELSDVELDYKLAMGIE